jgi:hypothetical protein
MVSTFNNVLTDVSPTCDTALPLKHGFGITESQ